MLNFTQGKLSTTSDSLLLYFLDVKVGRHWGVKCKQLDVQAIHSPRQISHIIYIAPWLIKGQGILLYYSQYEQRKYCCSNLDKHYLYR